MLKRGSSFLVQNNFAWYLTTLRLFVYLLNFASQIQSMEIVQIYSLFVHTRAKQQVVKLSCKKLAQILNLYLVLQPLRIGIFRTFLIVLLSICFREAIVVLLMSMVNEKQPFLLRCAVLYCFQCFLFQNEEGQRQLVKTLLPSSAEGWLFYRYFCSIKHF